MLEWGKKTPAAVRRRESIAVAASAVIKWCFFLFAQNDGIKRTIEINTIRVRFSLKKTEKAVPASDAAAKFCEKTITEPAAIKNKKEIIFIIKGAMTLLLYYYA